LFFQFRKREITKFTTSMAEGKQTKTTEQKAGGRKLRELPGMYNGSVKGLTDYQHLPV